MLNRGKLGTLVVTAALAAAGLVAAGSAPGSPAQALAPPLTGSPFHGELRDDEILRLSAPRTIVRAPLVRGPGHVTLGARVLLRHPYADLRLDDDEIATAAMLRATAAWVRGAGPRPYPLAEGAQDHLIGLAVEEAADTGRTVVTGPQPWF
jgi:hypothetical protein